MSSYDDPHVEERRASREAGIHGDAPLPRRPDPARLTDQQIDPDECPACEACEHSLVKAERRLEAAEEQLEAERAISESLRKALEYCSEGWPDARNVARGALDA